MAENNGLRAVGAGEDVPHGEQDRRQEREIYYIIIYMINIQDFYVYFYVLYIFLQ